MDICYDKKWENTLDFISTNCRSLRKIKLWGERPYKEKDWGHTILPDTLTLNSIIKILAGRKGCLESLDISLNTAFKYGHNWCPPTPATEGMDKYPLVIETPGLQSLRISLNFHIMCFPPVILSNLDAPNLEELSIYSTIDNEKHQCFYHRDEKLTQLAKFVYENCPKIRVFNGKQFDMSLLVYKRVLR